MQKLLQWRAGGCVAHALARGQALADAVDGELQAVALGGLEHVVGHALLEGLHRVLVVGGDEDDLGWQFGIVVVSAVSFVAC